MPTTERWAALVDSQGGLVRRDQLVDYGCTDEWLRQRVKSGRWQRVLRGVYATSTGELGPDSRARAALLFAGEGAMLHELTACARQGARYLPSDDRIHVLVSDVVQRRPSDDVVLHRTELLPRSLLVAGLPCSPVGRAAIDLCRRMTRLQEIRAIICDVVQRRLASISAMQEALERGHSAGSLLPRRALLDVEAGCRSAPECELRDLIARSRLLPEPEWNVRVEDDDGLLLGYPDAWWREPRLAAEVNSREHHFGIDDWEATMRRQAQFAAEGILVVPISPTALRHDGSAVLAHLESAYASRVRPQRPGTGRDPS